MAYSLFFRISGQVLGDDQAPDDISVAFGGVFCLLFSFSLGSRFAFCIRGTWTEREFGATHVAPYLGFSPSPHSVRYLGKRLGTRPVVQMAHGRAGATANGSVVIACAS